MDAEIFFSVTVAFLLENEMLEGKNLSMKSGYFLRRTSGFKGIVNLKYLRITSDIL